MDDTYPAKYARWWGYHNGLEVAAGLIMASLRSAVSTDSTSCLCPDSSDEIGQSPVLEASLALQEMMWCAPSQFSTEINLTPLIGKKFMKYTRSAYREFSLTRPSLLSLLWQNFGMRYTCLWIEMMRLLFALKIVSG
jgi:hypothetical protein